MVVISTGPVLLSLFGGVVACWLLSLGRRITWPRTVTVLATSVYGASVMVVTALPPRLALRPGVHFESLLSLVNLVPLVTIDPRTFLLNVAMTVPLGLVLPLLVRVRSVTGAALAGLLVSAGIESAQGLADLLFDLGRAVDVTALAANTTGTVLGLLCLRLLAAVTGPTLTRFALPGSALTSPTDPVPGRAS
jgi:glycopeptide antibiotics resistance protein